jgi:hypothetical protein
MMLFDTVNATDISGTRLTNDGFLVAEAKVARTGIQLYSAGELGLDGDPSRIVRVYRPSDEVFAADAMASYAHRPVTVDHPSVMVDAANWKEHAKGQTGDEVLRDGEFVRVPLMLMDKAAIDDWSDGKRELSMGYTMTLDVTDGETPDGEKYDAIQRNLRMNHLALVARARGGSQLRLGDNNLEVSNMSEVKLQTVTVDGLSVQTTDAGAQAISKLQTELADAQGKIVTNDKTHEGELATKDAELATKDAEIDSLKGKVLSDADIDKRVNDRADLIATAKQIADKDYAGLSDAEIKSTAVVAKLGQATVDGKSVDYISARFDILAEDATQDPVRKVVRGQIQPAGDAVDQAHATMVSGMENAWKQGGAE